ncbi:hypothetical protein [Pleurocapsa sp. PCC 7319]|uniref:hypothetical protein n=1 Tax=Pleurocapsa sp. PCC 7319 TaxID=118161 RepID=UPI00034B5EF4|nr:hypothetical protein [Pleurocapsa sp. PCC 7319]
MNILLIERYNQLIQDVIKHNDAILGQVVADDELCQDIKNQWYPDNNTDWEAILRTEIASYSFDPSIYPDNFFNE